MRVRVQNVSEALHPNEAVVEIKTSHGVERLVVDRRAIIDETLSIGAPIAQKNDLWLIELPRETMTGAWRVWVRKNAVLKETPQARVA